MHNLYTRILKRCQLTTLLQPAYRVHKTLQWRLVALIVIIIILIRIKYYNIVSGNITAAFANLQSWVFVETCWKT